MKNLVKELRKLAEENGDGVYGDLKITLADIDAILGAKDLSQESGNIRLLTAPTSNLQDLSIDCGWGEEFLVLADKIEKELSKQGESR